MNASRLNATDYQYNLYNEYLEQMDQILIKYGQQSGLSIQYWHIRVDLSLNYDDLKMQNSYKHYVYDILHFVPTVNMTPVTYQIGYDQQQQGTSNLGTGSFSMYLLDKPLPGDLFKFYAPDDSTDKTEIFRITDVQYMRTSKNKMNLYQLDFETAPIFIETMEHVRINQILCWDSEQFLFLDEEQCGAMEDIQDRRDELIKEINKYYDAVNGWYGRCLTNPGFGNEAYTCGTVSQGGSPGVTRPLVFVNTILKRLKRIFDAIEVKPIFGIGTAKVPISWALPDNGDYWDTFTCLSFKNENAGQTFNVTRILEGACVECPPEFIQEIECHRGLMELVLELIQLLEPLMTPEQLNDATCDRNCCDATDINYIIDCAISCTTDTASVAFDDLFWDVDGAQAGSNAKSFCDQYENAACIPLFISWRDGAHWPGGGFTK